MRQPASLRGREQTKTEKAESLEREFESSMQAVMAAAIAIDASML